MLTFRKKEDDMRKFDNATELTYLSKKIENLDESMEAMEEWMDNYNERQKVVIRMLVDYFNRVFTPEQMERFHEIVKQKETMRWLKAVKEMDEESEEG